MLTVLCLSVVVAQLPACPALYATSMQACSRHPPVELMPRRQADRLILVDGNNLVRRDDSSLAAQPLRAVNIIAA